jgi:hypothetical protein
MTDFRALCAELVKLLEVSEEWSGCTQPQALTRARAALAEHPVGPTRQEAVDLYSEVMAAHDCQTLGEMAERFARAVLAHSGQP